MENLSGKVAFITGGASGIGLGIAKAFAGAGMKLAIADIDDKALALARDLFAKRQVALRTVKLDVRDRATFTRVADEIENELGPVEVLVNNAGVGDLAPLTALNMTQFDWVMKVNLDGVVNGVATFLPRLLKRNSGYIVSTASDGVFRHLPGSGAYCVAKAGVIMLMELLRADLVGKNIGTTLLLPGLVNTGIVDNFLKLRPADLPADARAKEMHKILTGMLPRGMDPEEVGRRVLAAVKAKRFWLFTDPAGLADVAARDKEILAALDAAKEKV
jgi:NAD(P)-dependent dehydrogenase (short-subunit alcohol dehydrogenase family)